MIWRELAYVFMDVAQIVIHPHEKLHKLVDTGMFENTWGGVLIRPCILRGRVTDCGYCE